MNGLPHQSQYLGTLETITTSETTRAAYQHVIAGFLQCQQLGLKSYVGDLGV